MDSVLTTARDQRLLEEAKTLRDAGPHLALTKVFEDDRGLFLGCWMPRSLLRPLGVSEAERRSSCRTTLRSSQGVLRGPSTINCSQNHKASLVRCVAGEIFDLAPSTSGAAGPLSGSGLVSA